MTQLVQYGVGALCLGAMLGFRAHVGFDFHDKRHHKRLKCILTKSESIEQSCVDSWRNFSWKQHRIMVN